MNSETRGDGELWKMRFLGDNFNKFKHTSGFSFLCSPLVALSGLP